MNVGDDLLPGDEDAILGALEVKELTGEIASLTIEKITAMVQMLSDQNLLGDILGNNVGGYVSNAIFNQPPTMPVFPYDSGPEAVLTKDRYHALNYGLQIYKPTSITRITSV